MARLQATPSSRSTATAPEPGRGEHFITSIVAFTQGPSIPQVPLVTADQQILFAQMAHLSLGVTLTSRLLVPAIDNVVPCQGETATLQWFASGLVSADFAPGRVLEEPASGERVAFESLSQLPFPIASRLDRPPRRGSAP